MGEGGRGDWEGIKNMLGESWGGGKMEGGEGRRG